MLLIIVAVDKLLMEPALKPDAALARRQHGLDAVGTCGASLVAALALVVAAWPVALTPTRAGAFGVRPASGQPADQGPERRPGGVRAHQPPHRTVPAVRDAASASRLRGRRAATSAGAAGPLSGSRSGSRPTARMPAPTMAGSRWAASRRGAPGREGGLEHGRGDSPVAAGRSRRADLSRGGAGWCGHRGAGYAAERASGPARSSWRRSRRARSKSMLFPIDAD